MSAAVAGSHRLLQTRRERSQLSPLRRSAPPYHERAAELEAVWRQGLRSRNVAGLHIQMMCQWWSGVSENFIRALAWIVGAVLLLTYLLAVLW